MALVPAFVNSGSIAPGWASSVTGGLRKWYAKFNLPGSAVAGDTLCVVVTQDDTNNKNNIVDNTTLGRGDITAGPITAIGVLQPLAGQQTGSHDQQQNPFNPNSFEIMLTRVFFHVLTAADISNGIISILTDTTPDGPFATQNVRASWIVYTLLDAASPIDVWAHQRNSYINPFGTTNPPSNLATSQASAAVTTVTINNVILEVWSANGQTMTLPATVRIAGTVGDGALTTRAQATAAAVSTDTATTAPATRWYELTLALQPAQNPPLNATLVTPADGAYVDATAALPVSWNYNASPSDPSPQQAYALRQKLSGAGSYSYWNNTTHAWQGTIVWNVSALTSVTLPANALTNGLVYNWSVATQSTYTGLQGAFAADETLITQAAPVVTITGPIGPTPTAAPIVTWTDALAAGAVQVSWRIKIYTTAQASVSGFNWATGTAPGHLTAIPIADSGPQSGTGLNWQVPGVLANGVAYTTFLQISQSGNQLSNVASQSFTIGYDAPATPDLTAAADTDPATGAPRVLLTLTGHDNYLTANQASMEVDATGWTVGANTTDLIVTSHVLNGAQALRLQATAPGSISVSQAGGHIQLPPAGSWIGAIINMYPETGTLRTINVVIKWLTVSGTLLSTSTGAANESAGVFTQAFVLAQVPAGATQCDIVPTVLGATTSERHILDSASIFPSANPNPSPAWFRGGLANLTTAVIQGSDDGGTTWVPVRGASAIAMPWPSQQVIVYDYESPPATARLYRAQLSAPVGGGFTLYSSFSAIVSATTVPGTSWWIKDPLDTTIALSFNANANVALSKPEKATARTLIGRDKQVVVTDGLLGVEGTIPAGVLGWATYQALRTLIEASRTLLLQSPFGEQYYVHFGIGGNRQYTTMASTLANPYTQLTLPFVEVDAP